MYGLVSSAVLQLNCFSLQDIRKHGQARRSAAVFPAAKLRSFSLDRETGSHGAAPSPPKHTRHITTYTL